MDFTPSPRRPTIGEVRRFYPLLTAPRLLALCERIGLLAATQPDAIRIVETLVESLQARPTPARAELPAPIARLESA